MKTQPVLIRIFGNTPRFRVLDFVLTEMIYYDYTLTEIAKHTDVSWGTINTIWKNLKKLDMVRETRQVGNAKLYAANKDSPYLKTLKAMMLKMSCTEDIEEPIVREAQ
ncbi:MAG: hypothetical protein HZB66_02115 [Candidatus Aenigmarchaeota archaeon]|nr:hypothetical protein [Candidatus Aenigmarchaeota archaeon]